MNNFTKTYSNRTELQIDTLGNSNPPDSYDGGIIIEIDDHEHTLQFFLTKDEAFELYDWLERYLCGKNITHLWGGNKP